MVLYGLSYKKIYFLGKVLFPEFTTQKWANEKEDVPMVYLG